MKKYLIFALQILLVQFYANSQNCPTSISITGVSVTPSTCSANGTATINGVSGSQFQYRLVSGPAGYSSSTQDNTTFTSLAPGNYTVRAECKDNPQIYDDKTFSITDQYTKINFTSTVTSVCTSYIPGGIINITNIVGSALPLEYAVVKSDNSNIPNTDFPVWTTLSNGATSAPSIAVNDFGKYQVRIKDACGEFRTVAVEIKPTYKVPGGLTPTTLSALLRSGCDNMSVTLSVTELNTGSVFNAKDFKVEVWENVNCSSVDYLAPPTSTKITPGTGVGIGLATTVTSFAVRVTSPCGASYTQCYGNVKPQPFVVSSSVRLGCTGANNNSFSFSQNMGNLTSGKIWGYSGPNGTGTELWGPISFTASPVTGLPDAESYKYEITGSCSDATTITGYANAPTGTPSVPGGPNVTGQVNCVNEEGMVNVGIGFQGKIAGAALLDVNNVKLVADPGGAEYAPYAVSSSNASFRNIPPGNYKLILTPGGSCEPTALAITVTGTPFSINWDVVATTLCGANTTTGTVQASVLSGNYLTSMLKFQLLNASGATVLAENNTGTFTNLIMGNYKVRVVHGNNCSGLPPYTSTKDVSVVKNNEIPKIETLVSLLCQATPGYGIASFKLIGNAPYKVYTGTSINATNWNEVTTINSNEYLAENLVAGDTYYYRFVDNCGNAVTQQVTISNSNIALISNKQPCEGSPYTLEIADVPNASYSWSKNGSVVSTSNKYQVPSYQSTMDGEYVCTVKIGNCAMFTKNVTLNSNACNQQLGITFGDIKAKLSGNQLLITWASLKESNNKFYEIEYSDDGNRFAKVASVASKAANGNSEEPIKYSLSIDVSNLSALYVGLSVLLMTLGYRKRKQGLLFLTTIVLLASIVYSCTKDANSIDKKLLAGNEYIRIASVDKDGNRSYSKIIKIIKE